MKKIISVVAALCFVMGSFADDMTCQEAYTAAMQLEHNTPATEDVTVHGFITFTDGVISRNQQVFWMADDPDGGKVFEAYWANLPEPFLTNGTPLPVGTELRLTGKLMRFNSTAEIKNGNVELINVPVLDVDTIELTAQEALEEAIVWSVGDISNDYYQVSGKVKAVTYPYAENQDVPGFNGKSSFTLEVTHDSIEFEGYNCYSVEEVFAGDSVIILGKLQFFNDKKVEIAGGKVTITKKGEHEEAKTLYVTADEAVAEALTHEVKWLSTDVYVVSGVVDSISYAYNAEKGTHSFYLATTNETAKFCAYSCKVPREIVLGDVVTVKGRLLLYAADLAEIKDGEVTVESAVDNIFDNVKSVKRIENGQVIIIRNGVRYNLLGTEVR